MAKPLKIRRTFIARDKLEELYAYSCEHWGEKTAEKYLMNIESVIQQAARDHGGTSKNPQFSRRFTCSLAGSHYVFFEVKEETLFVVTIFHAVMDIKTRLAEEMTVIQREIDEDQN